uniref:Uncharacterized protein n=1 Tax=virus sp. ctqq75 TaxID=2827999 RepID=A0A8S5RE41_9VIRU|nr:MAG TPA: hypothetical protein [virus sp. ctqq75]
MWLIDTSTTNKPNYDAIIGLLKVVQMMLSAILGFN